MYQKLLIVWFVILLVLFLVSGVMLTNIQLRLWKTSGWRAFKEHSLLELYWTNISPKERMLLWPGIAMFFITLFFPLFNRLFVMK